MRTGLTAISQPYGQIHLDTDNGEEIRHVQPNVTIALGDRAPDDGEGTLYITTKRIIWVNDVDKQSGYSVDFLSISLHAVSRDPEAYPLPCIYAQIESNEGDSYGDEELEAENNDGDLDLSQVAEMRLIPSDVSTLDDLFKVLCTCAELNPEPEGELEGEGDWIFSAEDMANANLLAEQYGECDWEYGEEDLANPIGHSNGLGHNLHHNILELRIDDERFKDAEETEDETQKTKN